MLLWMQPRIQLAFWAVRAHCWLMSSLPSTSTPGPFWKGCAPSFCLSVSTDSEVAATQVQDLAFEETIQKSLPFTKQAELKGIRYLICGYCYTSSNTATDFLNVSDVKFISKKHVWCQPLLQPDSTLVVQLLLLWLLIAG